MTQESENKYTATDQGQPDWHPPLPEKIPEPTVWPLVQAFGATLIAWGVVTSWIISVVGLLLFVVGTGGWVADMRHDQS